MYCEQMSLQIRVGAGSGLLAIKSDSDLVGPDLGDYKVMIGVNAAVVGGASEHEGITVVERPLQQLALGLDEGRLVDGKLVTLILALRLRKPELFTACG